MHTHPMHPPSKRRKQIHGVLRRVLLPCQCRRAFRQKPSRRNQQFVRKTKRLPCQAVSKMQLRRLFAEESGPIRVDTAQFFTGATKQRAYAVFSNSGCHTDFVVASSLQMKKPYDVPLRTFQFGQKSLHLVLVTQDRGSLWMRIGNVCVELV